MSWVAVAVGVGSAAVGAYSSSQQASAARRAAQAGSNQSGYQDTTSQNFNQPYAPAAQQIDDAFSLIQQEYQRGAHQQAAATGNRGGGGAAGGGGGAGASQGEVVVQGGVPGVMSQRGKFQPLGAAAAARWRQQGSGGGGATPAGPGAPPTDPTAQAQWFAQQTANDVANPSRGIQDAEGYAHDVLTGGTDAEPFARNPILNDLTERLGTASFDRSQNLLEGFLGGRYGAGTSGAGGTTRPERVHVASVAYQNQLSAAQNPGAAAAAAFTRPGAMPDSMDDQNSWFNQQVTELFDPRHLDPANDPTVQPILDMLRRQMGESLDAQLDDIGDEATGLNMYGGSGFQVERGRARGGAEAGLSDATARTLAGSRESALARRMAAMGGVSERDMALLSDATQRYGIDSAARSAANSASAGAGAMSEAANRQLDLQAILGMQGMDQFGLGTLGELGSALNGSQEFASGTLTPTLEGLRDGRIAGGFGMSNTIAQQRAAQQNAAANRSAANRRASALAPGQDLEDYLSRLTGLANPYAVNTTNSHTQSAGAGGSGYAGPSPTSAGMAGAMGGFLQGYGSASGWGGANRAAAPAAQPTGYYNPYAPPPGRSGPY